MIQFVAMKSESMTRHRIHNGLQLPKIFIFGQYLLETTALSVEARRNDEILDWSRTSSSIVVLFEKLSGKKFSRDRLSIVSTLKRYVRQTDDFIDNGNNILPPFIDIKHATRNTLTEMLKTIDSFHLSNDERYEVLETLMQLRRHSYQAFKEKNDWSDTITYDLAYDHRLRTTGILGRTFARVANIVNHIPVEERSSIEEGMERCGMILQFLDDFMDVRDDSTRDGNLILATLCEEPAEYGDLMQQLHTASKGNNVLWLFNSHAPLTTKKIITRMNKEVTFLSEISPVCAKTVDAMISICLPRIILSNEKFYKRIRFW